RGDTLQLTHSPNGNLLVVTGDLAQLQMDKIFIIGPEVNIDQTTNQAWVNGVGVMRMESNTDFQGNKINRTVPLDVHWNKRMFFDGLHAEFHGNIQAEQENSRLACQAMQVTFDHPVSLKEGQKGGPQPKVKDLICDKCVRVEERTKEKDRLVRYQRIECPGLTLDNDAGITNASGPGDVRILQPGGANDGLTVAPASPRAGPAKPADVDQLKLTRVMYRGKMYSDNKNRVAMFFEDVDVVHVPADNADLAVA